MVEITSEEQTKVKRMERTEDNLRDLWDNIKCINIQIIGVSEEEDENAVKGKVQIMTLHKSKGDEFDYVFMPEMSEKNLTMDVNQCKLKTSAFFMEQVRGFNPKYKIKSDTELKEFSAEESMRLFYVAVTRAKKKLYITAPLKVKSFGKESEQSPSIIFNGLF